MRPKNEMFTRHVLAKYCQEPAKFFDQYLQVLKLLAKNCKIKAVLAVEACTNYVRNVFSCTFRK